jgi:hypothetical protein
MPGWTAEARSRRRRRKSFFKHVELHAKEAHPDVDLQSEQVEALVKSSDQAARGNERATTLLCELNPLLGQRSRRCVAVRLFSATTRAGYPPAAGRKREAREEDSLKARLQVG